MKFAAGIVTYNPEINCLQDNIEAIKKQISIIYIIDNDSNNIHEIETLVSNNVKCKLIKLNSNKGIAKALNIICQNAYDDGYEWVLTLDQDSVCPSNMIEEYKKYLELEKCAMLTASIFDRSRNLITTSMEKKYVLVDKCITSGTLMNLNAWKEIGGFDEYIFIDGVDFDICYRINKAKYKIYRINSVILSHEIGKSEYKKIFKWKVIVMHHSPFRKYYIARNNIYLAKKGMWNLLRGCLKNLKLIVLTLLYEKDKITKVKKIIKGTIDGFNSKI